MARGDIEFVIEALEADIEKVVTKLTLDITANLIETTPVDTGWARANWIPSIGTPFSVDLTGTRPDPGTVSVRRGTQSSETARVATSYRLEQGKVWISNNVPYIQRLNDGSSVQAPSGFVQAAIAKGVSQLRTLR